MADKVKIKVIKKDEIKSPPPVAVTESRSKRHAAREIVSNVTNWVSELQVRKRDETKAAIEKFFTANPRPSES